MAKVHHLLCHSALLWTRRTRHDYVQQILQSLSTNEVIEKRSQQWIKVLVDRLLICIKDGWHLLLQDLVALLGLGNRANERIDVDDWRTDGHLGVHLAQLQSTTVDVKDSGFPVDDIVQTDAERSGTADRTVVRWSTVSLGELTGQRDEWKQEIEVHSHENDCEVNATNDECVQMRSVGVDQITAEAGIYWKLLIFDQNGFNIICEVKCGQLTQMCSDWRQPASVRHGKAPMVADHCRGNHIAFGNENGCSANS